MRATNFSTKLTYHIHYCLINLLNFCWIKVLTSFNKKNPNRSLQPCREPVNFQPVNFQPVKTKTSIQESLEILLNSCLDFQLHPTTQWPSQQQKPNYGIHIHTNLSTKALICTVNSHYEQEETRAKSKICKLRAKLSHGELKTWGFRQTFRNLIKSFK